MILDYLHRKIVDYHYINALNVAASICNHESFSELKNCNYGKNVALCGAGPSLEKYEPIDNCIHIALNRALLNPRIKFDYFFADDWTGIHFFQEELKSYNCIKYFGHAIGNDDCQIPESFRIECDAKRYYTDLYRVANGFESRFVCDIDKMAIGNMANIALSIMQVVLFTNPKTIYLVGCDASAGHFIQPDNLKAEEIQRQEEDLKIAVSSNQTIQSWVDLKKFAEVFYPDTKIISINPVGLKGIFVDEYQSNK